MLRHLPADRHAGRLNRAGRRTTTTPARDPTHIDTPGPPVDRTSTGGHPGACYFGATWRANMRSDRVAGSWSA